MFTIPVDVYLAFPSANDGSTHRQLSALIESYAQGFNANCYLLIVEGIAVNSGSWEALSRLRAANRITADYKVQVRLQS